MTTCRHRRKRSAVVGATRLEIWNCAERGLCTEQDHGRKMMDGAPMAVCETCPLFAERDESAPQSQTDGWIQLTAVASTDSPTGFGWTGDGVTAAVGFWPKAITDTVRVRRDMVPVIAPKSHQELVGDHLHQILEECGVKRSACSACHEFRRKMNAWGVAGCAMHRAEIIQRLDGQAKTASWFDAIRVAGRGYLTSGALLDEAIKRARR